MLLCDCLDPRADPDGDRKIGLRQFFKLFQVRGGVGLLGVCDGARTVWRRPQLLNI